MSTKRSYLSKVVVEMPDSGIKDFFDIAEKILNTGIRHLHNNF